MDLTRRDSPNQEELLTQYEVTGVPTVVILEVGTLLLHTQKSITDLANIKIQRTSPNCYLLCGVRQFVLEGTI